MEMDMNQLMRILSQNGGQGGGGLGGAQGEGKPGGGQGNGFGALAGGLWSLFGHHRSPEDQAAKYYDRIPGEGHKYYDPYIESGNRARGNLEGQYGEMTNDPGALMARLMKGYKESPGFNFEKKQGLDSIENAAASGGMMGTQGHQQQAGDLATQLSSRDSGDYLKNAMGLYGRGIEGEEGMNKMGFEGSDKLAEMLSRALMSRGNLAYQGQAGENNRNV